MKLLTMRAANFLTLKDTGELHFDDRGLVLVQGVNEDDTSAESNGSGKSSIADAICWGLYGETARGESGDAVVNRKAKKDCGVTQKWLDGETEYYISRYRKHKDHGNKTLVTAVNGGTVVDLTKGTEKETQLQINDIMGATIDVFKASIYAGQEAMPDLPMMTDKNLKTLIEKASGSDRFEGAYRLALAKLGEEQKRYDQAATLVLSKRQAVVDAGAWWKKTLDQQAHFEMGRGSRAMLFRDQARNLSVTMMNLIKQAKEIDEEELRFELGACQNHLDSIKPLTDALNEPTAQLNRHRNSLFLITKELQDIHNEIEALKNKIRSGRTALDTPCGECGKPHTPDEFEAFTERNKRALTALLSKRDQARELLRERKNAVEDQEELLAELKAKIPDVSTEVARMNAMREQLAERERLVARVNVYKEDYKQRIAGEQAALTEPNPHDDTVKQWEVEVNQKTAAFNSAEDAMKAFKRDLIIAKNVAQVYSPAALRAQILDTVTPYLNERTAEYLSLLSDGNIVATWTTLTETAKGELREKFNIEVENEVGAASFKGLSGGEKRKVRLSTMLALQDLQATRAAKPIDLWVGDEIDDALDGAGLERLMTALEIKAREKGTVLVVSHNSLRDWIDNVVTVTKKGGYSTVEGALS